MKIIADDKIPFLKGVLEPFAEVDYIAGSEISPKHVKEADALLIRTRTRCDGILLDGSRVKFIGTATIGYDHVDTIYCDKHEITWKNAPGCNASSVNQYVSSALVYLSRKFDFRLRNRVLGVVGVGNVGSKVVNTAELLGMRVYLCDPPRVRDEGICGFISLEGIIRECDIITFHVPLNCDGEDRTLHMIDSGMLRKLNPGTFIINTSRGEVADTKALLESLEKGNLAGVILDVWENEPRIDSGLLTRCILGTPHIAGYSADGKARGTTMVVRELSKYFNLGMDDWEPNYIPEPLNEMITVDCLDRDEEDILSEIISTTYRVEEDDQRLREAPAEFEKLRGNYPVRREFRAYTLSLVNSWPEIKRICRKLGFKVL
jgi:erythronate-4-phosphate dehydrogenase